MDKILNIKMENKYTWVEYLLYGIIIITAFIVLATVINTISRYFTLPLSDLVNPVADDEFYVLQVAKNFAMGKGITFDGLAPTSGFHPLYFLLLSLIYLVFTPGIHSFLLWSIVLKIIFTILSTILIVLLTQKLSQNVFFSRTIGVILSLIFISHPYVLFLIFSGIEQLLSIFFLLILLFLFIKAIQNPNTNRIVICGIALGLAFLSRTDNIILFPILLIFTWVSHTNKWSISFKHTFFFGIGLLLTITPWYILMYVYTGTISQGSGQVKMFLGGQENFAFFERLFNTWQFIKQIWWPFLSQQLNSFVHFFWFILLITGANLIISNISFLSSQKKVSQDSKQSYGNSGIIKINLQIFGICILYLILLPITYGYLFNSAREWYYGTSMVAIIILIFVLINFIFSYLKNSFLQKMAILIILLFSLIPLQSSLKNQESHLNKWSHQHEMLYVNEWLKLNLPPDVKIGSWNSGVYGYFSERSVTNLDGLINNDILPYLKSNDLYTYIEKRKINYIIDYSVMIYWNENYLGQSLEDITIVEDTTFSGSWSQSDISVWRIIH